ncbi:MAG: hypothetical protein U0930_18410 [Pirellulales bacterium]
MAKLTPSQLDRSRPSSRLQPQTMLETTPVLFRLPSVQLQPLPPVADFPTESLMEFHDQRTTASLADNQTPQPVTGPAINTQADDEEAPRSWWEHWSSGVILILLLIAAYFACIAVLKSKGKAANTLAKDPSEIQDANNLMIPPIITELQPNASLGSLNNSAADDLVNSLSLDSSVPVQPSSASTPMAKAELLEPKQMPDLPMLDSFQPSANGVNVLPVSNQLGQSPTLYDGASNTHQASNLTTNFAEPSLPEFTPQALSNGLTVPTLAGSPNAPAAVASNNFTLNGPSGAPNLLAGNNPPPALNQSNEVNAASANIGGMGIPNLVPNTQTQQPATSTVSSGMNSSSLPGSLPGGSTVSSSVGIRTTNTPEATDEVESIIRAYIELSRAGQLQSSSSPNSNNRYQPAR